MVGSNRASFGWHLIWDGGCADRHWVWLHRRSGLNLPDSIVDGVLVRVALELAEPTTVEGVLDTLARELTGAVARASECTISTWDPIGDQLVVAAVGYADEWPEEDEHGKRYALGDYPGLRDLLHRHGGYVQYRASDPSLPERVRAQLADGVADVVVGSADRRAATRRCHRGGRLPVKRGLVGGGRTLVPGVGELGCGVGAKRPAGGGTARPRRPRPADGIAQPPCLLPSSRAATCPVVANG